MLVFSHLDSIECIRIVVVEIIQGFSGCLLKIVMGFFKGILLLLNQVIVDELAGLLRINLLLFAFLNHAFDLLNVLYGNVIEIVPKQTLN